ncbi:MAG TPA: large-conductance mechanosensitive channel protein MscL [Opitutaceae bacterium]|jgi:large conductance mechanosensitive channel|nr:large-conductance mechanosensitive channel protein MscL [Opitutaceae bacterium]
MFKEFKEFALKGNVVDLAVGVIIGGAFGAVVTSLVKDVIMPPIGLLIGGVDFSNLVIVLKKADAQTKAVTLNFGIFINTVISFTIVACTVFILVKGLNRLRRQHESAPAAAPAAPRQEVLLEEIRDLLKKQP